MKAAPAGGARLVLCCGWRAGNPTVCYFGQNLRVFHEAPFTLRLAAVNHIIRRRSLGTRKNAIATDAVYKVAVINEVVGRKNHGTRKIVIATDVVCVCPGHR